MDLRRCALLSIDLQNEYRTSGAYPVEGFDQILANATQLIAAARASAMPVIHAQAWVRHDERQHYPLLEASIPDELRSAVAGSAGAELCREVAPTTNEPIVRKRWPSAFKETELDSELRRLNAADIMIMGVWTDSCVRATVFDAIYQGYRVSLVKDACGSGTEAMHRTATLDIANRLYGGGILRTAEALKALRGEPYTAWRCTRPVEFLYTLNWVDTLYETL